MPAKEHRLFRSPEDLDTPIWRYMDFTKFVSMLDNGGLFFCRADLLGDPFEGSYPSGNINERQALIEELAKGGIPKDRITEMILNGGGNRRLRELVCVNCWHLNHYESAAMWSLYTRSNESIAVRSTFRRLRDLLDEQCYLGLVHYLDYRTAVVSENNLFRPYLTKRMSFVHEHEVRAITTNVKEFGNNLASRPMEPGIWKTIPLQNLIEAIFLAPNAPEWFRPLVASVSARFGLHLTLEQSDFDSTPLF